MANATCEFCNQEMSKGNGCTDATYDDMGPEPFQRIPSDGDCHDCNVTEGQLHHPGCDMERCPKCKGQAISCGCAEEYSNA